MDGRPTLTDCDEAGDYIVPNVLSPRSLVSRPDSMDETVPHTVNLLILFIYLIYLFIMFISSFIYTHLVNVYILPMLDVLRATR